MIPLDYYGRLLRRAKARPNAVQIAAEDPFEMTAPWLDEPTHDREAPVRQPIAIERRTSPRAPDASARRQPGPAAAPAPPESIMPLTPRAGDLPVASSDPFLPPSGATAVPLSREAAGDGTAGGTMPPTMLVPPSPPTSVGEGHAVPSMPSMREGSERAHEWVDESGGLPERPATPARSSEDGLQPRAATLAQMAVERAAATRLVPTLPRVAALPPSAFNPSLLEGAATSTVTIDHIDIEIEHPAPPPARELVVGRRTDASPSGDSVGTGRELWRGPTNQAFGLGQV